MNFQEAMELAVKGEKVVRDVNKDSGYIYRPKEKYSYLYAFSLVGGTENQYSPEVEDIFADDWIIYPEIKREIIIRIYGEDGSLISSSSMGVRTLSRSRDLLEKYLENLDMYFEDDDEKENK